jgi:long-chain acyl-CoA synthetase
MADFKDFDNIHQMLCETVKRCPDHPAYRWFISEDEMASVTWHQFLEEVRTVAKALFALGVRKDDKVTIISYSCYRWVLTDLAIASIGAVTVGIYHNLPAGDCQYIVEHSDSTIAFVENQEQYDKIAGIRNQIPAIRKVILFDGASPSDEWATDYESFRAGSQKVTDQDIAPLVEAATPDDIACIVYTSGTTGVPKGAMLTHDNITFTAQSVAKSVYWEPADHVFLFLPLAHVFARTCVYTSLLAGCTLTFSKGIPHVPEELKIVKPHWFPSVPRIFEKVHAKIIGGVEAKGGLALKLFNWAMKVGHLAGDVKLARRTVPLLLHIKYSLADRLIFSKIKEAFGGRVRWCISGAAPLNPDIGKFFHAAGLLIVEGIGMTENTSFSNLNRYRHYKFGAVGPTGPGIEQRIGEDDEIQFRGRNVMKGYYKMPAETTATFTSDGWLKTGDLGEIDKDGFLKVTGRRKEIIVTSGGKNIAPAKIEGHLATSKYINQVCVVGDDRNYLTALVTLDVDNIQAYAQAHQISVDDPEALLREPAIIELIEAEVKDKNWDLASFESIKKVAIVPEFTIENGLLTPTLKLKKNLAIERYAERIDALYHTER